MKPYAAIPSSIALFLLAATAGAQSAAPPPAPPTAAPAPAGGTDPGAAAPAPGEPAPAPPAPAPAAPGQAAPPGQALPPPPPPKQAEAAPPPEPPPPPVIVVETPPPPAPVQRSYHLHEGFYLRLSAGIGGLNHSVSTDRTSYADYTLGGGGGSFDALIGGSPAPGVAVGGALLISGTTSSEIEVEDVGTGVNANTSQVLIGAFIDGFPQPNGGLHVGGALGIAGAAVEPDDAYRKFNGGGFGGAAWIGYGFWVADEWSLGGMLRFTGSITREEKDDVTQQATSFGTSLLFTALYH